MFQASLKLNALLFMCFALLLASTVRGQTSGVNNAELNGDYAFTFNGFDVGAGGSSVFAAVGRFSADGAGNVTSGELDSNGIGPAVVVTAQTFTGTYAIGADNRGVMTLNTHGASARLAFVMMPNGNAQFIKFDAAGGTGGASGPGSTGAGAAAAGATGAAGAVLRFNATTKAWE